MANTSLLAYEPLSERGLYALEFLDDLTQNHEAYTHTINAVGGFHSAKFTLKGTEPYLTDWFEDGMMRRVVYLNPEGIPVWEGFVNKMTFAFGTTQKTKTMDNLYNRVYLQYSPLGVDSDPPTSSDPVVLIVDDLASQSRWGIKSIVQKGGDDTDEGAYAWARVLLEVHADPQPGENVNTSATTAPHIVVDCLGYYHTLKWIPFISTQIHKIPAHQVIQEVISYFGGINIGWISTDFGWMDYNFRGERRSADEFYTCWDVIADVIKRGGAGGERWVGGLYQNRMFIFKPAEDFQSLYADEARYIRALRDPEQKIYDEDTGTEVKPWDVVPDRVLKTVDL